MRILQRLGRWNKWTPAGKQQRSIATTRVRRYDDHDHHDVGGIPGANLPFPIHNRWLLALYMGLWMGSGFATPWLLLRHHLKKKSE